MLPCPQIYYIKNKIRHDHIQVDVFKYIDICAVTKYLLEAQKCNICHRNPNSPYASLLYNLILIANIQMIGRCFVLVIFKQKSHGMLIEIMSNAQCIIHYTSMICHYLYMDILLDIN